MSSSFRSLLPVACALALGTFGAAAFAQASAPAMPPQPSATEQAKDAGHDAAAATKRSARKAASATKGAAKKTAKTAKKAAHKTGGAVATAGHKTASGMRRAGHAIGEKVPGTAEHAAAAK